MRPRPPTVSCFLPCRAFPRSNRKGRDTSFPCSIVSFGRLETRWRELTLKANCFVTKGPQRVSQRKVSSAPVQKFFLLVEYPSVELPFLCDSQSHCTRLFHSLFSSTPTIFCVPAFSTAFFFFPKNDYSTPVLRSSLSHNSSSKLRFWLREWQLF